MRFSLWRVKYFLDLRQPLEQTGKVVKPSAEVSEYFSKLGKKKTGKKYPSLSRGNREYYVAMARRRWDKAKAKEEGKA